MMIKIMTKITDKDGYTKTNNKAKNDDSNYFCIKFPFKPNIGDKVIIKGSGASCEYIVVEPAFYEVFKGKAYPILYLKELQFDNSTKVAVND